MLGSSGIELRMMRIGTDDDHRGPFASPPNRVACLLPSRSVLYECGATLDLFLPVADEANATGNRMLRVLLGDVDGASSCRSVDVCTFGYRHGLAVVLLIKLTWSGAIVSVAAEHERTPVLPFPSDATIVVIVVVPIALIIGMVVRIVGLIPKRCVGVVCSASSSAAATCVGEISIVVYAIPLVRSLNVWTTEGIGRHLPLRLTAI